MLKNIILALALALALPIPAGAQREPDDPLAPVRTDAWVSHVLTIDGTVRMRAAAFDIDSESMLAFDFYPPTCAQGVTFTIPMDKPAAADRPVHNGLVRLQIDSNPAYEGPMQIVIKKGVAAGIFAIKQTDQFQQILSPTNLIDGLVLRMRPLEASAVGRDSIYSLDGVGPALARSFKLCKDAAANTKR